MVIVCFARKDAVTFVSEAESAPNRSGKGIRISGIFELASIDDFFVGCEMVSELSAVIVGDFGHDYGAVAEKIH